MKILLIEDEKNTAEFTKRGLKEAGYIVDHADNGEDGLILALSNQYDAMIIDRMLPKMDGLALIKELRERKNRTPILILSALGDVYERVEGLKAGADDYLPKPYSFIELLARLESLIRRNKGSSSDPYVLKVEDLIMDIKRYKVTRAGRQINLKPTEFKILQYLMSNAGQIVTKTMLIDYVWGYDFYPQTNVVEVHISRLRSKIDKGFDRQLIKTVKGMGYKIE